MSDSSVRHRIFWLSAVGILMQLGLSFAWFACVVIVVSHLTAGDPELQKIYLKVQQHQSLTGLTPSGSDADRFFEEMRPILSQVPWLAVGCVASLFSFGVLGFLYARLSGTIDYVGMLPVLAILTGQNPLNLTLMVQERGIREAQLGWGAQFLMLLLQVLAAFGGAQLGAWIRQRRQRPKQP